MGCLAPDYARLDETSLTRFLERQRIDARIERPRADLLYVSIGGAGTEKPIRLRVAILANADEAGRELHQGILQHGPGAWGVRRSNLAVLGPMGSTGDDIVQLGTRADGQLVRWSFSDITENSFLWRGEISADGGVSWRMVTEFTARRVA